MLSVDMGTGIFKIFKMLEEARLGLHGLVINSYLITLIATVLFNLLILISESMILPWESIGIGHQLFSKYHLPLIYSER